VDAPSARSNLFAGPHSPVSKTAAWWWACAGDYPPWPSRWTVERLAALSDGIFAVAMTLLVLHLRVPTIEAVHSERDLWRALVVLAPRLVMYAMSFITLGIYWVGQQTQLNHLARAHRSLAWVHLVFLFSVSIMPFSTTLLAQFKC